ncbi:MAG: hypothetical protein IV085_06110 [Thiobacillus sp.]|nr:hypothetical protein [Thiobacillus sp.]
MIKTTLFSAMLLIAGGLSLSACVASPAPQTAETKRTEQTKEAIQSAESDNPGRAYALDFLDEFTRAKLRKNGEFLFCDQQGYLDCFKVSRGQCLQELAPLKENCIDRANQKFPDRLANEKDIDRYASYFSVCMMLQHSADKDANALGSCLKNVEWDKAQRDKSLLK